jgi:hypothetical protein
LIANKLGIEGWDGENMRAQLMLPMAVGVAGLLAAVSNEAKADCNPRDFMAAEVKDIQRSGETELAFVLTATVDEFERAKKDAGGSAYGLFSGSYGEAQEKARSVAQATKFDYKSSYASSYFSQTLSKRALGNYVTCLILDKEKPGLRIWLDDRQGDYFTFKAFWVGADTIVPAAKYDAPPIVDGASIISGPEAWVKGTTEDITIKRNGNNDFYLS